jgi:amino acid transporter
LLPRAFGRLHPTYRTPHVALVVQGAVATLIFLASVFLTVAGGHTTIQEAYDILVNLTILIYFIPYLYLFAVAVRLRREPLAPGVTEDQIIRVPGGTAGLWACAISGFLATFISLVLLFVPPPGTENVLNYQANLVLQAVAIIAVGAVLYWRSRRGSRLR